MGGNCWKKTLSQGNFNNLLSLIFNQSYKGQKKTKNSSSAFKDAFLYINKSKSTPTQHRIGILHLCQTSTKLVCAFLSKQYRTS